MSRPDRPLKPAPQQSVTATTGLNESDVAKSSMDTSLLTAWHWLRSLFETHEVPSRRANTIDAIQLGERIPL